MEECACGCGQTISKWAKSGFARGHHMRTGMMNDEERRAAQRAAQRRANQRWVANNLEYNRERARRWYQEHKTKISNEKKLRYRTDPSFRQENSDSFRRWMEKNRAYNYERRAAWGRRNREKQRAQWRRSYARHRDERIAVARAYRSQNNEQIKESRRRRYREDPEYRNTKIAASQRWRRERGSMPAGESGPERIIGKVLGEVFGQDNVKRKDRSTIRNPVTGYPLELDFVVSGARLAIEVQGATHTRPIHGKKKFEAVQRNDRLKRRLCRQKRILLVEIYVDKPEIYRGPDVAGKIESLTRFAISGLMKEEER